MVKWLNITPLTKTVYVDDDFEDDPANHTWNTIQEGINDAEDGWTVIVRDGTYTENVKVNKSLTIKSENGSDSAIVHAADPYMRVFEVTVDYVTVEGFTVFTGSPSVEGIYLIESSNCNITDNHLENCYIDLRFGSDNNKIRNNTISNNDIGIYSCYSKNNKITDNHLENCGISIFGDQVCYYNTHTMEGNTVNGKPIYYYKNTKGVNVPEDAGQVILVNCSNMTVKNINASFGSTGIYLAFTTDYTFAEIIIGNHASI